MADRALDQALLLVRSPGLARRFRSAPLPDGILQVLRIAAGDEAAIGEAAAMTERSDRVLREAAGFYIVQVLLSPGVDSYRTLGTEVGASRDQLRSHMVWLLKWLHPDAARGQPHTVFATRVITAWERLRTQEARDGYDDARKREAAASEARDEAQRLRRRISAVRVAGEKVRAPAARRRSWRRWAVPVVLGSLIASCVALAAVYFTSDLPDPAMTDTASSTHFAAELRTGH